MKNSTFSAQVANNLLTVLQGYSKTIRLLLVMFLTLTVTTNAWGADYSATHTSNVSFTAGTNGSSAKVIINSTEYEAMKLGTSSKVGTMTFTIPVGTTKIHLHVAGWNGKNTKFNISAGNGVTLATTSITSTADAGINNNSPFTISSTSDVTSNYYKVIDINSGATTSETTITITTTTTGYRAVIWGVNAETSSSGGGGSTPTQLAAPTGLTESNITSSGATLSWNAVANASSYIVTIVDGASLKKDYPVTGITTTVSDLESSTDYLWTVTAVGDGINYTNSEESVTGEFTTSDLASGGEEPGTGGESSTATFTYTDLKGQGASGSGANFTGATKENIHMSGKGNGNNSYVQIYANNYLTFTPTNATITKIVLTATSGYIKTWSASEGTIEVSGDKATWTGNSTSMVTLTNTASAQARITQMDVTYTASGSDAPEPVIVKTLKSIAVAGMTTTFEQGDVFKFDGTCTATYSVTKDGAAQADETAEVTPTSVSEPDMSTAGTKEVTVTYTEGEITKTFPYNITVENTLPKIVITQNEVADFTNTYAEYTWTASGVSGKIYGYKNSGMQFNSSKAGSYVYNTDPIPGYIRKIKIVKASGTTRNWTPSISETVLTSADGTTLDQKEVAATTTWEVNGENSYFYLLESGGATVIESITIYYEAVVPQVAAPTFTPAAGTYNAAQNVTISAEAGTTIHYTLDGTEPTTSSAKYTAPIQVSETKTIKAIAVKNEKVSQVASATYTINLPLTTMDQIFAKATAIGSTATAVEITFNNWVVSAVKADGKTAFVTDGTKGFVIYETSCGFKVGDKLSGTAACQVLLYNGFAELTGLKSTTTGLSVSTGGVVNVVELDADGITNLTGVNTGSLIKINGICTSESSKYYVAGVQVFNSLYDFGTLEVGAEYNITGIYQPYKDTKEILPRSAADIEVTQALPTATISIANISLEIEKQTTIEATITPDAAKNTVTYTIKSGSEYITLSGTTITAKAVGTATITATIPESTGNYYGATEDFTVTVTPKNIATLPFAFDGGFAEIEKTLGISQNGLTEDYGSSPKLKFDGTGDYVIIHFDVEPGILSYDIKGNSFSGGTFTVQESGNGETYTDIVAYTELGGKENKTHTLASTSRYVKFIYTEKSSGNVALGNISIQKPDLRADAGLAWDPETVTLTVGDAFTAPTLVNPYSVTGISYETSNDAVATVTTEGVIALAGATGVATITATFDGNDDYKQAKVSCTITVKDLTTYTVTLNPNYPTGKTGTFIDKEENTVNGNLEISLPSGTATQPIADLYTSIALDGYIFEGWYDAASEGNYREKTGPITKDITFYAHWKVPYTVTFITGTSTTIEPITETTADGIKLPAATLEDCGNWVFLGWAENAIASETTTAPASILYGGSTYKPTANITLYAIYKRVEGGGGKSATLTFDDTSKRTTRTTNQQVWTENGITLTNNKSESTDTVAAYYNPVRFYKSSEIIIEAPGNITQIVASTSGAEYTTALQSSVGPEASATSNVVTITPTASSNTYTINLTAGQTRLSSITVTYGGSLSTSYYHSTPLCQVTITYYGFGGGYTTDCETDPNAIVITKGDTYQIPNCEPTDYDNTLNRTFAGTWNTKANGKGTAYKPGEEFIVNSDITLYAQWTLNTIGNTTLPTGEELLANTDIVVTGGNTLTLQAGTTTINSLTLKGGLQENGTYAMPVVNIPEGATLVRNNNKINLDLKINNNSYYPFAVPFEVANTSANVNYINTTLKEYANAHDGYGNYYRILEYNGALRAENGVNSAENWVHVGRTDVKLMPGKGYAISAVPASGQDTVTIRITMNVDNAWLANGEQESITVKEQTTTRNQVTVTAHGGKAATEHQRHAGWNFVANPYLSMFAGNNASNEGGSFINGEILINKGNYSYGGENVPYVTIPTYNFAHYYQVKLSDATLSPAYSFFVQVGDSGTMTFGRQQAPASIAARNAEERPVKMDVDITLSDNHRSDATGLIICDRYNDEYEIGRDLEKMFGSAANLTVYTLMADNTPLAYQALAIRSSMQVIPVGYRAPEQGEYTFRLNEATSSIDLLNEQYEQLVLVDYQTGELTNLLIADYTFYSERTQADNRFAIYAVPRQNAPTDLPNAIGQDKQAQKIIHNGHLYILRDGNVYNGNGQIVK